jgi:hypothetical protein
MPQKLYVKQPDGTSKAVYVHRSWQDISGKQIFLHHDGTYGDKSGNPIRNLSDLNILPAAHRKVAESWWSRIGREKAEDHYQTIAEKEAAIAGDFQEQLAAEEVNTALDSVLYARKPQGKKGAAIGSPKSWLEYGFGKRPDWWGQANEITFNDFTYVIFKETPTQEKDNAPAPPAETN